MTNKTRSVTALNVALSLILLSSFGAAKANSDDRQILDAAKQLGLLKKASTSPSPTHSIRRSTPVTQINPYEIKRQQQLRQNQARKKARLVRLQQLKQERLLRMNTRYLPAQRQPRFQRQTNIYNSNLWGHVYNGFRFQNHSYRPIVRRFTNEFSRNPARIEQLSQRASEYLYMVVNELKKRNMPTELALLPFVESAYRNKAYSHAGAAGMWQFIPSTGRIYGLKQTGSYDARLDSFKATRAALDYLQKLHRQFRGDWFLALAAYNAGENRVQRAINENRSRGMRTDYWNLNLPRETTQYVPRLLAFKQILRNPRAYRVRLRAIPNAPRLTQVRINKPVDLRKAATHAGLPSETLAALNPSYLHGITTPRFSNRIIVPRQYAGRVNNVIRHLAPAADVHYKSRYKSRSYKKARRYLARNKTKRYKYRNHRKKTTRYLTHKVRRGDNLYRIALKHGTTVKKLRKLNNLRSNKIKPGKRLKIAYVRHHHRSHRRRSS